MLRPLARLVITSIPLMLLTLLAPQGASAQRLEDRGLRVAANVAVGAGGKLESFLSGGPTLVHTDTDLDATVGFDLRAELPVADFLVVGGWFEFLGVDDAGSNAREEYMAFDAFARLRWVVEVMPDTLYFEPYVLLPFGISLAVLPEVGGSGQNVWPGWNTAALGGAAVMHESGFGGFLELGWRHAEVYRDENVPLIGARSISLVMNEFAFNIGVVYAFQ